MLLIQNVTKKYGKITAVNNVSFILNDGDYFALLGPNGAGKTTIVRMIMGFSHPSSGSITIDGIPSSKALSRKSIGYVSEMHRIPPFLTGKQYLFRNAMIAGMKKSDAAQEINELITLVGMQGKENFKAQTYSKGMTQRIALAAALIGNPKLLIVDEPVSGLDPIGIRDVRILLEKLRTRGTTLFLNSHLLSEVEKLCDTAAILANGCLLKNGKLSDFMNGNESLEDVFIKCIETKQ